MHLLDRPTPSSLVLLAGLAGLAAAGGLASLSAQEPASGGTPAVTLAAEETLETADGTQIRAERGRLRVPENRSDPGSRSIELAFVRLHATGAATGSPVVYLAGGPGGWSTFMADSPEALSSWRDVLGVRDVILLDQRGTGRSSPNLVWRYEGPPFTNLFRDSASALAAFRKMGRRAAAHFRERGVDLRGYTTVESADDLDALRRALGLERLSLMGLSYGSHLALATVRRHGEHLEDVIVAGVEGPWHTYKLPRDMDTQFGKISILAAGDPGVGGEIDDLEALLDRVLAKLDREPMVVAVTDPRTEEPVRLPVGGFGLRVLLRMDLGDATDIPVIPRLLHSIDGGDPSVLRWFVQRRYNQFGLGTSAMTFVMDGASGVSPGRWDRIRKQAADSRFGNVMNFPFPEIDEVWNPPDLGAGFRAPLVSDVRTLFLSGTLDWNAPPYQAAEVRWGFPRSDHIVVRNAGHEQILPHERVRDAIVRFLRGEAVDDLTAVAPPLRFVPLEGRDPEIEHPAVPRSSP